MSKILKPAFQAYADFLIQQLSKCESLDLYEYLIYQAATLEFYADELNIELE